MPSLFTVIITTKNRPDYLKEAFTSVTQQQGELPDIIVVDDGSDTPVYQQIDAELRQHCRILRNEKSVGVSAARNQGTQAAGTKWLIFLDDDDWLSDTFLRAMTSTIQQAPSVDFFWPSRTIVYQQSDARKVQQASTAQASTTEEDADNFLAALLDATTSGMAFRRSALVAVEGFDEQLTVSEDRDLIFKLLTRRFSAQPVNAANLYIRVHDGPRLSQNEKKERQAQADLTVVNRHREFLQGHPKIAYRFIGRVAKRLWENGFCKDAVAVTNLQCRIAPYSLRARKRQLGWGLLAVFKQNESLS